MKKRWHHRLWMYIYVIYLSLLSFIAFKYPRMNWDVIPYMYLVLQMDHSDASQEYLHIRTYQSLYESIPHNTYSRLITRDKFTHEVYRSPQALYEVSSLYKVKPLYVLSCWLLNKVGVGVFQATYIVSVISMFILGLLLYKVIHDIMKVSFVTIIVCLLITINPFWFQLSTLSTPDALSSLFIFLTMMFFRNEKLYFTGIFSVLAVLTRADNIIFITLLLCSNVLFEYKNYHKRLVSIFLLVTNLALYFWVMHWSQSKGWETIFHFTFIKLASFPLSNPEKLTIEEYLRVLYRKMPILIGIAITLGIVMRLYFKKIYENTSLAERLLFGVIFLTLTFKIFLIPLFSIRLYLVFILFLSVLFLNHYKEFKWSFKR